VLARATLLLALAACGGERRCEPRADHTVVACLDGSPIGAAEVAAHLGTRAPDRRRALDAALRVRVFAAEAARRGLGAELPNASAEQRRAMLHQALIADEAPDPIDDAEARRYYEAHPGAFNKITATTCRGIFVEDRARAEALARELAGASDEQFAAAGGVDLGEMHQPGVDPALTRLANDLRAAGAIGGPVRAADGRYAILRATAIEMAVKPYEDVAPQVKNHLAHAREEEVLAELFARLRARHTIEVLDAELAHLPVDPLPE
jgi:hypothetical protein